MTNYEEVIASPFAVFLQAFTGALPTVPDTNATLTVLQAAGWELLGARGVDSVKRDGVTVELTQEFATFMGANSIKMQDRWRTSEDARIAFSLVDARLEVLARALDQTVTEVTTGTPDYKELGFGRPRAVKRWSVMIRGLTPYALEADDDRYRQFLMWNAQVTSPYSEQPNRDTPAEVPFELKPLAIAAQPEVQKYGVIRAWSGV